MNLKTLLHVKRHAICGTLATKVRHIYDVKMLFERQEIKTFLEDETALKALVKTTKDTDSIYLTKRNVSKEYDPTLCYDFQSWKEYFIDENIRSRYETLHKDLLYTNEKQDFQDAVESFKKISRILEGLEE